MPESELKLQMDRPPGPGVRAALLGWMGYPVEWAHVKPGEVEPLDESEDRQGTIDEALQDRAVSDKVNEIINMRFGNLQPPADPCQECQWKGGLTAEGFCPICGCTPAEDNRIPTDAPATATEGDQDGAESIPGDAADTSEEDLPAAATRRRGRAA